MKARSCCINALRAARRMAGLTVVLVSMLGVVSPAFPKTLKSKSADTDTLDEVKLKKISRDIEELDKALKLTLRQKEEISTLLLQEKERKVGIMKEAAERMRQVSDNIDKEIKALLTEAQRMKLDDNPIERSLDRDEDEFLKTFR